jgi:hypothetical protein
MQSRLSLSPCPFPSHSPLQVKSSCSPQDRKICPPLHRDCARRDQATPAPHHRCPLLCCSLSLSLSNPSWSFPCHLLLGPLSPQRSPWNPCMHGFRSPWRKPPWLDQASSTKGGTPASRSPNCKTSPPWPGLYAPLLWGHSHRCAPLQPPLPVSSLAQYRAFETPQISNQRMYSYASTMSSLSSRVSSPLLRPMEHPPPSLSACLPLAVVAATRLHVQIPSLSPVHNPYLPPLPPMAPHPCSTAGPLG